MKNLMTFILLVFILIVSPLRSKNFRSFILDSSSLHLNSIELKHNIPSGLLSAISKVESGRYHQGHKKVMSWPWVIHAEGKGQFFSSKQEAINAVKDLKRKGIKNIDVGLMQINLHYHPEAFSSLEQAFDPKTNIEYAARFLKNLKNEHSSWSKAVAHYHSALPEHHIPYREKVFKTWQQEKKNMFSLWTEKNKDSQLENHYPASLNNSFKLIRIHRSQSHENNSKQFYRVDNQKYQRKFNPSFKPRLIKLTKGENEQNKYKRLPSKNSFRLIQIKR